MAFTTAITICLLLTAFIPHQCNGFSPTFIAKLAALAPSSMDHRDITKAAALTVLQDYLLDNPNTDVDSTRVINGLRNPSAINLFGAYLHGTAFCLRSQLQCRSFYGRYSRAVGVIEDANSDVDDSESSIPEAHFDNELIPEGNNRLLEKRENIINHIRAESYQEARSETGRALHTLQDFYSHSNWVELGNTEPMADLGRPGRRLSNLAGRRVTTCIDCEEGAEVGKTFSFFGGKHVQASREYNCRENIQSARSLTTGYYGHNPNAATVASVKPRGKCSHGGVGDITSDFNPVGGINKDTKSNRWSPHSYLHDEAADLAVKASILFFQDIREAVGEGLFAKFLDIELLIRSSIAFVIDTTGSMREELPQIQASLPRIQSDLEAYEASLGGGIAVDYILVPFNDPDPGILLKTTSIPTLIGYIQNLRADGGGDCREPSIDAAIRAARESHENALINLYTDAPPSDEARSSELISIIREKRLTMNNLLTAGCSRKKRDTTRHRRQSETDNIYEYLSAISGGQTLEVSAIDLSSVDSVIFSSFKPSTLTIFQQTGSSSPTGSMHTVEFRVDSTMAEFQITINGNSLGSITLLSPQGQNALALPSTQVSLASSQTYVAAVNVSSGNFYGIWQLSFTSYNSYRVFITGDSNLLFGYNLYRSDNTTRSGLSEVTTKVLPGEPLLLVISIDQELEDANVTTASILSSNGTVLNFLSLTAAGDGYFYAETEAPASFFQIQISGVDRRGYQFTRISRAGVDTTDVQVTLGPGQSPFQVLRAKENRTLTLLLTNYGPISVFTIEVAQNKNSSGFLFRFDEEITLNNITLESRQTRSLSLILTAQENITAANTLSLILTLFDNNFIERSNFLNIDIAGTSVPPVNRSEIEFFNVGTKAEGAVGYVILLACLLIGTYTYLY